MLATRTQEWKRQLKAEGIAEGEARGKTEMLLRQFHCRIGSHLRDGAVAVPSRYHLGTCH